MADVTTPADLYDRSLVRWIMEVTNACANSVPVLARVKRKWWRVYDAEGVPLGGHMPTPWLAWKSAAERVKEQGAKV
jgi:hypothetical protein